MEQCVFCVCCTMRELYRAWRYFCLKDIGNVSKLLRMCRYICLSGVVGVGEKDSPLLRSSNSSLERLKLCCQDCC